MMQQAEWIHRRLSVEATVDDVYDVLLSNIIYPRELVSEVHSLSLEYENLWRKNNDRQN